MTFGGSNEDGSSGSAGSAGSGGSSGTSGSDGADGADGASTPGGSVNDIQYKTGASSLGRSKDFSINTSGSPTVVTLDGNQNITGIYQSSSGTTGLHGLKVYANMHSVGPVYSSSGTSGFHSLQVAGTAVATQGDIVALAIALG